MPNNIKNLTDYAVQQIDAIAGNDLHEFSIKVMDDNKTLLVCISYGELVNRKMKSYFLTANKAIYQFRNGKKVYRQFLSDITEI